MSASGSVDAFLAEAVRYKRDQCFDRLGAFRPFGDQPQRRPRPGGQHHQAHDRCSAYRIAVAGDGYTGVERFGALDEFRGRAGMQSLAIANRDDRRRFAPVVQSIPPCSGLAGEHLPSDANVFAPGFLGHIDSLGQRSVAAHACQLDEHRQINPGDHLDIGFIED